MKHLGTILILLLALTVLVDCRRWWRSSRRYRYRSRHRTGYQPSTINPESAKHSQDNTESYCGIQLDVLVKDTCHDKWYDIDSCGACRKKRDLGLMTEAEAKSFLAQRSLRRRRSIYPSIYEECCKEVCSVEEVREHC